MRETLATRCYFSGPSPSAWLLLSVAASPAASLNALFRHYEEMGIANYLAQQMHEDD